MATKLQNRDEFIRWYSEEKRPYSWIIQQYREKYNIEIGTGTISNWRHQLGLEPRQIKDPDAIPWGVEPEHRDLWALHMLRVDARIRAGAAVSDKLRRKYETWRAGLLAADEVIDYDPEHGVRRVKRRPNIDKGLIREPDVRTRVRGSRD